MLKSLKITSNRREDCRKQSEYPYLDVSSDFPWKPIAIYYLGTGIHAVQQQNIHVFRLFLKYVFRLVTG